MKLPNADKTFLLKVVVFAYLAIMPFVRVGDIGADLLPIFVVGCVVGAALLSLDVTLGTLVLLSVAVTMIMMNPGGGSMSPDPVDSSKTVRPFKASTPKYSPVAPEEPLLQEPVLQEPVLQEDKSDADVINEEPEQKYLFDVDGEFVTEEGLAAAQTNVVGDLTTIYSPTGKDVYSAQGIMSGLGVSGM